MKRRGRVAVIGAGSSGLTSIKSCLEEGFDVVCFEKTDHIGGLWRYQDEVVDGVGCVAKNTVLNSSKELSAFSDFPPPNDYPNFMHNSLFLKYLQSYAEAFKLCDYIRYGHEVLNVIPTEDHQKTGQWYVQCRDVANNNLTMETVDAVIVCSGHFSAPNVPDFPGLKDFKGRVMHSSAYRKPGDFGDKTVLVMGLGNSGGDIAAELSYSCAQVYLSTRRGTWVIPRIGPFGQPMDLSLCSRYVNAVTNLVPFNVASHLYERRLNSLLNHRMYNLQPSHRALGQQPFVNDVLPARILSGTVSLRGNVKKFTKNGVIFEDDPTREVQVDIVIMATGFNIKFPFLSKAVAEINNETVELFKFVFPPKVRKGTLAFVGLVNPLGSFWPVAEMQARWASKIFSRKVRLPSYGRMMDDIAADFTKRKITIVNSSRHKTHVDWINYMDDIASRIKVKPNFARMMLTDPALFRVCMMGPCLPYQYRLEGPQSWHGAREALLTYSDRVLSALTPQTQGNTQLRRCLENAWDFVASCGLMIFIAYMIALVI